MLQFGGSFDVAHPLFEVYRFLMDPRHLAPCLPDLKGYEVQDDDHFSISVWVGFGRVRGVMAMQLEIVERNQPCGGRIVGKGSMLKSGVQVEGNFSLSEVDDRTTVSWSATAKMGSYLMSLVGGIVDGMVKDSLDRFVAAVAEGMDAPAVDRS